MTVGSVGASPWLNAFGSNFVDQAQCSPIALSDIAAILGKPLPASVRLRPSLADYFRKSAHPMFGQVFQDSLCGCFASPGKRAYFVDVSHCFDQTLRLACAV